MKFSGHVKKGTRKKWLDFGCHLDHCLDFLDSSIFKANPSITQKLWMDLDEIFIKCLKWGKKQSVKK